MAILDTKKTEDNKKTGAEKEATMQELYQDGKKAVKGDKKVNAFARAYDVLVKPLVTEKASVLASQNKYVFMVNKDTNKVEIAKAINEVYGVYPKAVNVVRSEGKDVRFGRYFGKRKDWKKAIVTLPAGKTIQVYEGV